MKFVSQGQVIGPADVEQEIIRIVEELERGSELLITKVTDLGDKSLAYDLAFARALHRSTAKSEGQRKAEAMLACETLYSEMKLLETVVRTLRDAQHDLRAELDGVRSLGTSVRAAMFNSTGMSPRPDR